MIIPFFASFSFSLSLSLSLLVFFSFFVVVTFSSFLNKSNTRKMKRNNDGILLFIRCFTRIVDIWGKSGEDMDY